MGERRLAGPAAKAPDFFGRFAVVHASGGAPSAQGVPTEPGPEEALREIAKELRVGPSVALEELLTGRSTC